MAFSESQRVSIRKYLGYPAYATYDTTLEGVFGVIGAIAEAQTAVEGVLSKLAVIETEVDGLHAIALAKKVEESELDPERYRKLYAAGRREVQVLSTLMNVPVRRDVFASGGWCSGPLGWG